MTLKKGVSPHLSFCPRCREENNEILLFGNKDYVVTCEYCRVENYGGFDKGKCGSCGKNNYNAERRKLRDTEKVPGSLCEDCKKEIENFKQIVKEGGIYWKCSTGHYGVIKASAPIAKAIREETPDPVGVHFNKEQCPRCKEKI
jgi:hypothetical protein